ncbi:MAG TPA: hypothetical protein PKN56_22875 [Leptospiraceae bacterium]|nr:hypothetical protein [Leptospiraceae bacterium]HMY69132.1 hypothetical protein [Leptospiraceae bacterium]HNF25106.1 hypothetical protein [Leptospiraceae bacterium]HNM02671.1 hypothetical protein [Leptospiraceae bacterium]HNN06416.1 hypothetical protein [Leptospiraceae bacterium]
MALSTEQIIELQKYQKMLYQLEKILLVSGNEDQKKRVSKTIQKYKSRILSISPDGIPDEVLVARPTVKTSVESKSSGSNDPSKQVVTSVPTQGYLTKENVLSNLVIMKVSPNSHDTEINMIATLVTMLEQEYVPVLSDSHIKFDFSHVAERDGILKHLENIQRTMKVLSETIEEYALSEKQDFKEQLGRMKNKQSRIFIAEAGDLFKTFKAFLDKVLTELNDGISIIMNLEEKIQFNPKFEKATILQSKTIPDALRQFYEFIQAALDNIAMPGKLR